MKKERGDPVVAQALDDPLMTDPDLSSRNEAAAAITIRTDGRLPVIAVSPEEIAAARAEAAAMVGGSANLSALPQSSETIPPVSGDGDPAAAQLATLLTDARCRSHLAPSTIWAARLPGALPVYPRGQVVSAAGSDAKGCRVRAIAYRTPVSPTEVTAFYHHLATTAGLTALHASDGAGEVLRGTGEGVAYDIRVRRLDQGALVRLAVALR